jgi:hypothetical protein
VELVDHFADIAVHLAGAGLAQLVAAEAAGLDGDAADTRSAGGLDIPHAVADSQRATRIDGKLRHGAKEDVGVWLGAFDVIGGSLTVNRIIGIERLSQRNKFVVGRRGGKHHHQASSTDPPQSLGRSGKREDIAAEFLVPQRPPRARFGTVTTEELGEELISPHTGKPMDGVHRSPLSGLP